MRADEPVNSSEVHKAPVRAARITDIARVARVSTATVSRVLADPDRVSAAARARVLAAIAEAGYVPNSAARTLRSQKTRMVLVVLPDLDNGFFSKILRGIEETLFAAGYGMVIGNLDGSPGKEARFAAFASAGQFDGAILLNGHLIGQTREGRGPPARLGLPVVALCEAIEGSDIPQIEIDNRAAARRMVEYLASLGHRTIGYIQGPPANILERERCQGYRDGLAASGIAFDPALVWPGDYSLEAGIRVAEDVLRRPERPSAIFSSNDEMAIGLIRALRSAGVGVPSDLSVAGFDDIEFAAMSEPALTTIRQPRRELGRTGASILLSLLGGGTAPGRHRLETELIVRASTGRPARA